MNAGRSAATVAGRLAQCPCAKKVFVYVKGGLKNNLREESVLGNAGERAKIKGGARRLDNYLTLPYLTCRGY